MKKDQTQKAPSASDSSQWYKNTGNVGRLDISKIHEIVS